MQIFPSIGSPGGGGGFFFPKGFGGVGPAKTSIIPKRKMIIIKKIFLKIFINKKDKASITLKKYL